MAERRYVYQGNPKEIKHGGTSRRGRPQLTPPAARLRRLGATSRSLSAYRRWWEGLGGDRQRQAALGVLGLMTDAELGEQVEDVDTMHDWNAKEVDAWARGQANRALAAELAAAVEKGRDEPRDGLLRRLADIR